MKRRISLLLSLLLMATVFFSVLPVRAEGTEDDYQIRGLTTYLYSADSTTVTDALFTQQLPTIPYLEAADFLNHIFTVDFSTSKNDDGTYSVTSENGTMIVDPMRDTLYFDAFEDFIISNVDLEGSSLTNSYAVTAAPVIEGETRSLILDPGAYGIDLIEYGDSVYIPLPTLADLAAITYNTAEYVDGTIYFVHTMDDNEWIDRSPLDLNLDGVFDERDCEVAYDLNFAVLCTPLAFSCGNLLPCMARDNGIAVLGDTSGGGSCGLFKCFTEGGYDYMLSSPRKFLRADGTDADLGSGADYYLVQQDAEGYKDYSGLYDLEEIGRKIHEYYGN